MMTKIEIEADQIDMDMHRLAGRLDGLAEMLPLRRQTDRDAVYASASAVSRARTAVRKLMAEQKRKSTL